MKKFFKLTNLIMYLYGFILGPVLIYSLFKLKNADYKITFLVILVTILQILPLLYVDLNFNSLLREKKVAIISLSILFQILANIVITGIIDNIVPVLIQGSFLIYQLIYIVYLNHEITNEYFDIN